MQNVKIRISIHIYNILQNGFSFKKFSTLLIGINFYNYGLHTVIIIMLSKCLLSGCFQQ